MNKYIQEYISIVRSGEYAVCEEQLLLCDYVKKCFSNEDLYIDEEQLEKYLKLQKYFPFKLFPWEVFCFTLHNCTYIRAKGEASRAPTLRFPSLFITGGRGLGKNGYLGFEDFCLLTPVNGIKNYHIDIFAMSEEQAKRSWKDVYDVLENNLNIMKKHFFWTKEIIKNKKTGSEYRFHTRNPKTKDSYRPGKVNHDEIHGYENGELIDVAVSGLGKVAQPHRTVISTNGDIRSGAYDLQLEHCIKILKNELKNDKGEIIKDYEWLPFICRLDEDKEIHEPDKWHKANPSLRYMPNMQAATEAHYKNYCDDPITYSGFMVKRMNIPLQNRENAVTSKDNLEAAMRTFNENILHSMPCIAGIDYAKINDFCSCGLLFYKNSQYYWVTHTFICEHSTDLHRIKPDFRAWAQAGHVTMVNAPEIPPELPVAWLVNKAAEMKANILRAGIDDYRFHLMKQALDAYGFHEGTADYRRIYKTRPMLEMKYVPMISSAFTNHNIFFGNNEPMRWFTNNTKVGISQKGNMTYDKIEPKSRKTDGFKAFVAAFVAAEELLIKHDIIANSNFEMPRARRYL